MCHAVRCKTCNKTTWAGCGSHVALVKAQVPRDQWCDGTHPSTETAARPANRSRILAWLSRR